MSDGVLLLWETDTVSVGKAPESHGGPWSLEDLPGANGIGGGWGA